MKAAIYDPTDGRIIQITQGAQAAIEKDGRPFVVLAPDSPSDIDVTHHVVDGAIVAKG